MKLFNCFCLLIVLALVPAGRARAQAYAPDTEFHDRAQRLFVVEAARILAWRENRNGQKIAQITYKVSVDTNRVTAWELNWLEEGGKSFKQMRVNYPESLLSEGPAFYRTVFEQIWTQGKWSTPTNLTPADLNANFWKGAAMNGMARDTGLRAAFDLLQAKPALPESLLAPELGGLLTHVALPSLCGGVTLDSLLMARGAVWLALSESMLAKGVRPADENWAPIMFLAGRENAAIKLWKTSVSADVKAADQPVLFQWWNFFLSQPKARAAFEFVTDPKQRPYGMPMMTYYSRLEGLGTPLVSVLPMIYGVTGESLGRLYDYGAFMSGCTDIGGGRMLEGAWAAIFRTEWLKTLKKLPSAPLDYHGYLDKLKAVPANFEPPKDDEASLAGLPELASILELGYEEGKGNLTPTAAVTARDLLNYGWEMNALQMGTRYYFVRYMWGIPDLAETIFQQGTRDIQGQAPFFKSDVQGQIFNLQESLNRVQMVDDLAWRLAVDAQPFAQDVTDAAAARVFYKRCWLRPYSVRFEAYCLARSGHCDEMMDLLRRYHAECGPKSDEITVEYLNDWTKSDMDRFPELRELGEQIAESLPESTGLKIKMLRRKLYEKLSDGERAQTYEKMFWENPDSGNEQSVFNYYFNAGAWKSAKRFYLQVRDVIRRDVNFSNFMSPKAWMLGYLSGDEDLMKTAVADSQTGSFDAMITLLWDDVVHDKPAAADDQLTDMAQRYEADQGSHGLGMTIKGFLPLMPSLGDPKNPDHEAALDYFGKLPSAVVLRWILIQKYKLSTADAIRFLGGKETDRFRRVLILALEKNDVMIDRARIDFIENTPNSGVGRVLADWLEYHLLKAPAKIEEKDLKPKDAQSIRDAVWAKVQQQ